MAIKINKDSIELTGKEFDIVRGLIEMNQNGELTLNLDNKDITNDEYDMPSLNLEVIMNTRSILNRVDGDNHYLNFGDKNCTDKKKRKNY